MEIITNTYQIDNTLSVKIKNTSLSKVTLIKLSTEDTNNSISLSLDNVSFSKVLNLKKLINIDEEIPLYLKKNNSLDKILTSNMVNIVMEYI